MKQIAALREGHFNDELQGDTVTFHEPMAYMDEEQQRLVLAVVCDKLRQLQHGKAPASLVEALERYAEALRRAEEAVNVEEMVEAQSSLRKAGVEKKVMETQLEYAESETTNLRKELEDWLSMLSVINKLYRNRERQKAWGHISSSSQEVKSTLADTTRAFEELKEQEPSWQESLEELRDLSEHQKAELEQHRQHIEHLLSALERREKAMEEVAEEKDRVVLELTALKEMQNSRDEELTDLKELQASLRSELQDAQSELRHVQWELTSMSSECEQVALDRAQLSEELLRMEEERLWERGQLSSELERLQAQLESLQEEADGMRLELTKAKATREVQTQIVGPDVEEQLRKVLRLQEEAWGPR